MSDDIPLNEQVAKSAFESFYRNDVKASNCPVPWGHSWVESRWKFWWAAWQTANSSVETSPPPPSSKERLARLPHLLRDAERRVNAHVFKGPGDSTLCSIPANVDRDVDLLLIEAASAIELFCRPDGETKAPRAPTCFHAWVGDDDCPYCRNEEAMACFAAAEVEGWSDALVEGDIARLRDVWDRRLGCVPEVLTGSPLKTSTEPVRYTIAKEPQ
jgi:hypothetical protein